MINLSQAADLVKRLREDAKKAGIETYTFQRMSGALGGQLTIDAVQAADLIEALLAERDDAKPAFWIFTDPNGVEHGISDEEHAAAFRRQNPAWPETHLFVHPAMKSQETK